MFSFCFCKRKNLKAKLKKLQDLIDKVIYNAKARADFAALIPMNEDEQHAIQKRRSTLMKNYQQTRERILEIDGSKTD